MNSTVTDTAEFDPFASGEVARVFPTSEAQREVWLADQLSAQASLAFNESVTLRLSGALDAHALTGALQRLVARHDALRCTFGPDGTVWAHTTLHISVGGRAPGYTLAYVDLDDGPRILAHVDGGKPSVGSRVRVTGTTPEGDPLVALT